jgi:osmotically-inducible protein OsmY
MTVLALRLIGYPMNFVRNAMILALFAASVCAASWGEPVPLMQQSSLPPLPDQNAPNTKEHHDQMSTKDVQDKLQKAVDSKNVAYAGSDIKVAVDDQSITLNGTVQSSMQIEMAKQLARAYAGNRKVVSQLSIR